MKELYHAEGSLNHGFVGQITYTVCLPGPMEELDIALCFSKQHYSSLEEAPVPELLSYCEKESDNEETPI